MAYLGLETIRQGNSAACIQDVFTLHFPTATKVIDTTYGAGRFWGWSHNLKVVGMDIDPPGPVDVVGDYRNLPFRDQCCDVLVFDPMFIFSRGILSVTGTKRQFMGAEAVNYNGRTWSKQNIIRPRCPQDLLNHYALIFGKAKSLARCGLICKGQNLVVGKEVDYWVYNVITLAIEMQIGFPTDYLIQVSKSSRLKDPRWKQQFHFRRREAYYLIWKF